MPSANPRQTTQRSASFHDAAAKEAYASRFRPIAFPAVAAGTRRSSPALQTAERKSVTIPAVLRNGFDD